ncbi:WD40 repeat domain-containing protein [Rufibacter quisquiliarum]|uniref:WD40 repeat protein n=1 Tax=Rufibacter quisquiliarum TaxID=1549639 RepID=A0A839G8T2_9BACT|nr:WD40 repeat domain-containing protein [Rufibacter quisquiliarum]MBA9075402.1 WD40 repeat protein [Rufibacter quisquiliarum]
MASPFQVQKITTLTGHRDCVYTLERAPESHRFFSAGADGMVVKWDLTQPENGELVAKVSSSVYALKFVPERNWLLIGHNQNSLEVLDLSAKAVVKTIPLPAPSAIFDIQYHVETQTAFLGLGDGTLVKIDLAKLEVQKVVRLAEKSVRTIALHPVKPEMAVGLSDHRILILDSQTLAVKETLEGHTNSVFTVAYSPNGQYLLSGGRDAHLKVWNAAQQYAEHTSIIAHLFTLNHITFSPNGRLFATCSMDKSVKVWDAETFKLLKVIDKARHAGHGTSVNKLFWSAHWNQLVSCSDDRSLAVWALTLK